MPCVHDGEESGLRTLPRWLGTYSMPNAGESCLLHRCVEVTVADCFVDGLIVYRCRLVKAVIDVARSMSIAVIAERVSSRAEWDMLVLLGIDGMTGPAVSAAQQS